MNTTPTGALVGSNVLLTHLQKLRNEQRLMLPILASESDLESPRQVRAPSRYEMQTNTSRPHIFTEKEKLRSEFYAALDLFISEVERRFDQLVFVTYGNT